MTETIKLTTPEEAAEWLTKWGITEEHWQDVIDMGLYNHDIRTMASIALGMHAINYLERFTELVGDDEHGPLRIKNVEEYMNHNE